MPRTTAERRAHRPRAVAVITDLDGCLLDARTYGIAPARAALRLLRRRGVPLVLCTSKTLAEVRALFRTLGGCHLCVVEDGGGLFVPAGLAPTVRLAAARRRRDGRLVPLAVSYPAVRRAFALLRHRTRGAVRGFGDCSVAEVAALTGLAPAAAGQARRREFDEPFVFEREESRFRDLVRRTAAARGMEVTRGGRFYHLHGRTDKGRATRLARLILEQLHGPVVLVALGDSALDAPMLIEAEVPVVVPRPDGRADPALRRRVPGARVAPAPGPAGWARAVTSALRRLAPG